MNKQGLHYLIGNNQPNICQAVAYKNNEKVYSDVWNGYNEDDCVPAIGNSGNVIYINPNENIVISVASYFKPTVFDRVDFIQQYIEPFVRG